MPYRLSHLVLILTVLALAFCLGGCGSKDEEPSDGGMLSVGQPTAPSGGVSPGVGGSPRLVADAVTARVGEQVQVPLRLTGGGDIGSLGISIGYDPMLIAPAEVLEGPLAEPALLAEHDIAPGQWRMGLVSTEGMPGEGILVTLVFDVLIAGETSIFVERAQAMHKDSLNPIPVEVEHGAVTASG